METIVARTWRSEVLASAERFTLVAEGDHHRLAGTTRIRHRDEEVELVYQVSVDADWLTRSATIEIEALELAFDIQVTEPGRWSINDEPRRDLDGCVDIDLGWTPATNTLPIRRLSFQLETPATTRAVWLRWPELVMFAANQTYTKHDDTTWTYQQGDFSARLETDAHGVVRAYGNPPIWKEQGL